MAVVINWATIIILAVVNSMRVPIHKRSDEREAQFEYLLADLFRRVGWHVVRQSERKPDDRRADFVVDAGDKKYVIELKRSAEGRRDRLIPLLSQAILQAQAVARRFSEPAVPVAVVAAPRIPDSVAEQVKQFAVDYAPDAGIGVIDSEGFCAFAGHGLEALNAERSVSPRIDVSARSRPSLHLFSDLNQWMLKILLSANIPESLLSAPRGRYENASQLAQAAGVSVMSSFRLVRELSGQGYLDERQGWLRLVRIEELMQQWLGASQRNASEIPLRWIIRGNKNQLSAAIKSCVSEVNERARPQRPRKGRLLGPAPRICIGLFAAADLHGIGFVQGVQPHVYLERLDADVLRRLGLSAENAEQNADVYVRIPKNSEAVFRASVRRSGLPVSDILQVWLDASNHPARGKEQAEQIWRRILAPCFHKDGR
jgi:hypothetical protein